MAFQILVARESSFCPGVSRAFRIAEKTIFNGRGPFYSYGPLIHNPEVVERLRSLGLEALEPGAEDLPDLRGVPVVVRSHGIDTPTEERLKERGAVLVDATCPTVKHAQEEAARLAASGYEVVVIGSASHPEVQSIVGRTGAPVTVIESLEDASEIRPEWFEGARTVAVTGGASTPNWQVEDAIERLRRIADAK